MIDDWQLDLEFDRIQHRDYPPPVLGASEGFFITPRFWQEWCRGWDLIRLIDYQAYSYSFGESRMPPQRIP